MSPVTRILQEHAEQVDCNAIIPPMYYLENNWIGFDPLPTSGIKPQELEVDSEEPHEFQIIKDLGAGGLYTYQEIKKAQESVMFGLERHALNHIIVHKTAGQDVESQGYSSLNLFNREETEKKTNSAIRKIYGVFTQLGEWASGILGLYFIFRILKFVVETFINAVALHQFNGCSYDINQEATTSNQSNPRPTEVDIEDAKTKTSPSTSFAALRKELARLPRIEWTFFDRNDKQKPTQF